MALDTAPIAKIVVEHNNHAQFFPERWKWKLWIDCTSTSLYPDYDGYSTTSKRALKKAMKLVPRYVRTTIR